MQQTINYLTEMLYRATFPASNAAEAVTHDGPSSLRTLGEPSAASGPAGERCPSCPLIAPTLADTASARSDTNLAATSAPVNHTSFDVPAAPVDGTSSSSKRPRSIHSVTTEEPPTPPRRDLPAAVPSCSSMVGVGTATKGGTQCVLCGAYLTSKNILRHFKIKHPSYLGGISRHHPEYPRIFYFKTIAPRATCPPENRPDKTLLRGVENVEMKFVYPTHGYAASTLSDSAEDTDGYSE